MPTWIWVTLAAAAACFIVALGFWIATARMVNADNRARQAAALAILGRRPDGQVLAAPDHKCSCNHPKALHPGDGPCLRLQIVWGSCDWAPCGCQGWNP